MNCTQTSIDVAMKIALIELTKLNFMSPGFDIMYQVVPKDDGSAIVNVSYTTKRKEFPIYDENGDFTHMEFAYSWGEGKMIINDASNVAQMYSTILLEFYEYSSQYKID